MYKMIALLKGLVDRGSVDICGGTNKLKGVADNVLIGPDGCIFLSVVHVSCIQYLFQEHWKR